MYKLGEGTFMVGTTISHYEILEKIGQPEMSDDVNVSSPLAVVDEVKIPLMPKESE